MSHVSFYGRRLIIHSSRRSFRPAPRPGARPSRHMRLASASFFFMRAFLFWNQLYTFASFMGPSRASSSVICVRSAPLGVPIPVA